MADVISLPVVTSSLGWDGIVLRWYPDTEHEQPGVAAPLAASRHGVRIGLHLHEVPPEVLAAAKRVYKLLRAGTPAGEAEASKLVTHWRRSPYEPLERVEAVSDRG